MRTGLHPELGVSADDGWRPGAGDHNYPTCARSVAALAVRGRGGRRVGRASFWRTFQALIRRARPPGPWDWVRRRRAGPESQGGFSALWKRERDSGGGSGRHLVQVLEAGGEWGLPAAGPPTFPGAGDPTLFRRLWPGGSSASTGRSCPESLGLQAWRGLSRLLRSVWQMARKGPSSSFSFIFSDRVR